MKRLLLSVLFALSLTQVGYAALTDGLVAYYKLDESSGNASDSSGAGNTLTNSGTTAFTTGKINNGVNFTATAGQRLSITSALGYTSTVDRTWAYWVKTTTFVGYLVDNTLTDTTGRMLMYQNTPTSDIRLWVNGNELATSALTAGTWYYIVITKSGSTYTFYLNNSSLGTVSPGAVVGYTKNLFYLGSSFVGGSEGNAVVDEFGIWSRVLSATEISQLYNGGAGLAYPFATAPTYTNGFFKFFRKTH